MSKTKPAQVEFNFPAPAKGSFGGGLMVSGQANVQKRSPSLNSKQQASGNPGNKPRTRANQVGHASEKVHQDFEKQNWMGENPGMQGNFDEESGFGINVKKIVSKPREKAVGNTAKTVPGTKLGASSRAGNSQQGDRMAKHLPPTKEKSLDYIKNPFSGERKVFSRERISSDNSINHDTSATQIKKLVEPPGKAQKKAPKAADGQAPKSKKAIGNSNIKSATDAKVSNEKPPLAEKKKANAPGKEEKPVMADAIPEFIENQSTIEDYRFKIEESLNDLDSFDIEEYMKKSQRIE